MGTLRIAILINTDSVYPERTIFLFLPCLIKKVPEVLSYGERLSIDKNLSGRRRRTPDIGKCSIVRIFSESNNVEGAGYWSRLVIRREDFEKSDVRAGINVERSVFV